MYRLKSLIFICLFTTIISEISYGQISYEGEVSIITDNTDTLNILQTLELQLTFSDVDSIGGVFVSLYRSSDDSFFAELSYPISEIISHNYLTGLVIKLPLSSYSSGDNYRININPYNQEGLFLETTDLITNF